MLFSPINEELDNCLTCNARISNFTWQTNNGVCDGCPRLTAIAPQFWKVISHLVKQGDWNAQETFRRYG